MAEQAPPDSNAVPSTPTASQKKSTNDPLLQSIKQFVNRTNSTLASFEEATDETSTAFVSRLRQLGTQARYIATRAMATYEHRGQHGPQIVAGSAILFGGLVALRTGRVPGALAAGLSGAAAYGNVYGYEDYSATSWRSSLPKKE